jgi:signal transduction histidine kinase
VKARLTKQEVEDPDVSQELENPIEALQNALEALEDDD